MSCRINVSIITAEIVEKDGIWTWVATHQCQDHWNLRLHATHVHACYFIAIHLNPRDQPTRVKVFLKSTFRRSSFAPVKVENPPIELALLILSFASSPENDTFFKFKFYRILSSAIQSIRDWNFRSNDT